MTRGKWRRHFASGLRYAEWNVSTPAVDTQMQDTDDLLVVDSSSGPVQITLPRIDDDEESWAKHLVFVVKRNGGNNVTIVGESGETIDGAANYVLNADGQAAQFVYDGSNWQIIGGL